MPCVVMVGGALKVKRIVLLFWDSWMLIAKWFAVITVEIYLNEFRELSMRTPHSNLTPKLVTFYRERQALGDLATSKVAEHYSAHTLCRLVHARDGESRQAAIWGLGLLGEQSDYYFLGPWLRADWCGVRLEADRSRTAILQRVRGSWHQEYAQRIEDSMAEENWGLARRMADRLVRKHAEHPEAWLLRIVTRLCTSQISGAMDDCCFLLSFDRECYRALVLLGQCYWMLDRPMPAKECFLEAARIYPECRVAVETLSQ